MVTVLAATELRGRVGPDLSPELLRAWVETLTWRGPFIFFGLVVFRQFLFLPSWLILPVGGLCFGALGGTVLGSAGIVVSAVMKFTVARVVGQEWVRTQLGPRGAAVERRVQALGPFAVALATAHPVGPMAAVHWASGLSSIPLTAFLIAVAIGGPLRAAAYSLLGASLIHTQSELVYVASAALIGLFLLPLAHPDVRRWLRSGPARP